MAKPLYQSKFEAQDPWFVEALRADHDAPALAKFADRWMADGRAWAHEQMFRYLDLPWNCPGHQPVIKRMFKWAESQQNDELMAAFAAGCDRLIRRVRQKRFHWDWKTRTSWEETILVSPRDTVFPGPRTRDYRNPRTGEPVKDVPLKRRPERRLFSYHTRHYLRRRAWRYFRWLAYKRPNDYTLAIARALILYRDEDLERGENLLDCWTLMQACFRHHEALEFGSSLIKIQSGRTLSELSPSPRFLELWQKPESSDVLLLMVLEARSRTMRVWSIEMLRTHHFAKLQKLSSEELLELLMHSQEEVQQFASELLEQAEGLERWPLSTWMPLLEIKNLTVLETICRVMAAKVSGERLSLDDCLKLSALEPAPIARMGFGYLKGRKIPSSEDRAKLTILAEAQCLAIAEEIAAWALPLVGEARFYQRDNVLPFFDSLSQPIRKASWEWLLKESDPTNASAYEDAVFWCRLLETPFDETRQQLIDILDLRSERTFPRPETKALTPLWCGVLAGVHRGGRQKLKAIHQLTKALATHPDQAESMLPVLSLALRSIRGPEMREALAAVSQLAIENADLASAIAQHLPEVEMQPIGETVW